MEQLRKEIGLVLYLADTVWARYSGYRGHLVLYYRAWGGGLAGDQSGDTPCHGVVAGETVKQGCDESEASPSFQAVSRCRSLLPPGVYILVRKRYLSPPPFWKWHFFPSRDTSFFYSHFGLFALILPYFAVIWPFYLPFYHFLFPFFLFLPPFFLFLLHFPLFYSLRFHIFSPKWHGLIFPPPPRGGGYFPIYRPLPTPLKEVGLCGTASRLIQPLLQTHSFSGQSSKISHQGLHISSFQLLQGNRQFADAGTGE